MAKNNYQKAKEVLVNKGLAILPTDTIYGIHGLALDKKVVEKIYEVKGRTPKKPFIVLISSIKDLDKFDINLNKKTKRFLQENWPGKLSVVLPLKDRRFKYLHRGTQTQSFRVPKKKELVNLIKKTGPLISTSANQEGKKPAETINDAKSYFGEKIDIYIDEGRLNSPPSTVIKIEDGKIDVLRKGAVKINGF